MRGEGSSQFEVLGIGIGPDFGRSLTQGGDNPWAGSESRFVGSDPGAGAYSGATFDSLWSNEGHCFRQGLDDGGERWVGHF
ncbi:hypothetical protein D3C87_2041720 [compost metagenome]